MDCQAGSRTPGRRCWIMDPGSRALRQPSARRYCFRKSGFWTNPSFNRATVITHNPSNWFNETMFDVPLAGTLGNEPRNFLRGPDLKNLDFAINKDTKADFLGEQGIVQFRTEFFNILNRPNFSNPNPTIASFSAPAAIQCGPNYAVTSCQFGSSSALAINSTVGQITSTVTTSRQIQLSLKLIF